MIPGTPETCRESHLPGVGKPQTRQGLRFRVSESPKPAEDCTFRVSEAPNLARITFSEGGKAPNPPRIAPSGGRKAQNPARNTLSGCRKPQNPSEKRPSRQPKLPQQLTSKQPRAGCGPPRRPFPVKPAPRLDGAPGAPLAREDFSAGGLLFLFTSSPPHTHGYPGRSFPASAEAAGVLPDASAREARCAMRKTRVG